MNKPFIEQTAKDYDMTIDEVDRIAHLFPDGFYEKLEEYTVARWDGIYLKNKDFLEQTAKDYDMPVHEVERIARLFADCFYEKLEEYIAERAKSGE